MLVLRIQGIFFKCVWVSVDNSLHRETSSTYFLLDPRIAIVL